MSTGNQATALLRAMRERGKTRRGWVEATVDELVTLTGVDHHDIVKTLQQWKRLGYVKFTEHQQGSVTRLTAIRLTARGNALSIEAVAKATDPEGSITLPSQRRDGNGTKASAGKVGVDLTDARNQPDIAPGGPVERIMPTKEQAVFNLNAYPLVRGLVGRRERLLAAASEVEHDAPDLALTLMERAENAYSPLEEEVVSLLGELGAGPRQERLAVLPDVPAENSAVKEAV